MTEKPVRSAVKALTWRVTGTSSALLIAYLLTGDLKIASSIASIHLVINTILYYGHERVWDHVSWGKKK